MEWLHQLDRKLTPKVKGKVNVCMYHKNTNSLYQPDYQFNNINFKFKHLNNSGREGHTYLYHIIHNYNTLSNWTIFQQEDNSYHNPWYVDAVVNFLEGNRVDSDHPLNPVCLTCTYKDSCPLERRNGFEYELGHSSFLIEKPTHVPDINVDMLVRGNKQRFGLNENDNLIDYVLNEVEFTKMKNIENKEYLKFCITASFGTSKTSIHSNSLQIYKNLMELFSEAQTKEKLIQHSYDCDQSVCPLN
eukprot:Pgem_evm1s9591